MRILEASRDLLEERSWSDLTVGLITQRSGLTRSAFYKHFGDRAGLLRALLEELQHRTRSRARPVAER